MIISDHICGEIGFPMCKFISNRVCKGASRSEEFFDVKINSFYNISLLLIVICLTIRMIKHVRSLCSSIGRKEMTLFFHLYNISNVVQIMLLGLSDRIDRRLNLILVLCQLVLGNCAFFCLMLGSMTTYMFIGKWGMRGSSILYIFTGTYGMINTVVLFFGLIFKEPITVMIFSLALNFVYTYVYFVTQIRVLNRNRGEIWGYGTLLIAFTFFMISSLPLFFGSENISVLSDKYLDNLFFHNFFLFWSVVMVHKFWLSVCDYEVECLLLDVK